MSEPVSEPVSQPGSERASQTPVADLRLPFLGCCSWAAALVASATSPLWGGLVGAGATTVLVVVLRRRATRATVAAAVVLCAAVAAGVWLRAGALAESPVVAAARTHTDVRAVIVVSSDPRLKRGLFGQQWQLTASVQEVVVGTRRSRVRTQVLVFAPADRGAAGAGWRSVQYGTKLQVDGRLAPAEGDGLAALLDVRGPPVVLARPWIALRAAAGLRAGVRSAAGHGGAAATLLPALVDGDGTGLSPTLQDDFRTTGLTHLLAVSGTNLTLVVGFALWLARRVGVRARGLLVVGVLGVVGFVLLARPEPSVLRAAAMGLVALSGLGRRGASHGARAWGACVVVLMLLDPSLATSIGFALSALATAGILFLAPAWRHALARWLPEWLAEAVAVPMAAQLACTPLIAAISGQVSLIAVIANLLAAPVVGPATVLGLIGGAVACLDAELGHLVALPALWCSDWLVLVAVRCSALPVAAEEVPQDATAVVVLTLLCLLAAWVLHRVLARRLLVAGMSLALVGLVLVPLPTFGWPPAHWVLVVCDVGQGDGMVLHGPGSEGIVIDSGPDPRPMDRCLRRLGIHRIPLVVLTHFHADHVDGLSGVLAGRSVGQIEVSPYAVPEAGARLVHRLAARAHVPIVVAHFGETRTLGPLHWEVLAPSEPAPADSDSPPNDDSIVMYVETHGISLLMMGDEEDDSQVRLHELFPGLRADVLKVAHHGSAKQDPALVRSVGARIGLISVGLHNDYGHPAPSTLRLLRSDRIRAYRTDRQGSLAVVVDHGVRVVTRR